MAAASTRCRAVLVATLSVALLLTASRVEGFRALAVSDVDLEDGDGDVGVRPFLNTDNLSVGDELTSGNDTVGNVTEVADAPEENISGEAEDFLGTEDSVTNLTEIANDTTAAGADQTTALEEFVDNEMVDENLSGFPQGANKGTNGRRVLLSMADTVAQTISLDESVVNEDMNLAPEKNDTAHNVTEIANGTIALEEFVDNEMTGENISPCLTPTPGRRRLHQSNCGGGRRRLHSSTSVGFHPHFNIAPEMNATAGNVTELANDTIGLEEFVDNEMVDENLSGFPQGANKGTNGRRVLLMDIAAVHHHVNLAPEMNDTAGNVTSSNATVRDLTVSDFKGKGAGTCTYTNPFTQTPTCVQMTGSAYQDEEAAVEYCKSPGMPGAVGTFEVGASCAAFDDENFGGVCVTGEGTPEETAAAFVEDPTNAMAAMGSCEVTIQGCETFGGGTFYAAGGKCGAPPPPVAIAEDPDTPPDAIRPCCKAANAKCMACAAGVSVEELCNEKPATVGCDVPREEDAGAGATEEEEGGEVIGMEFPQGALNPLTYTGGSQDTFYIPPSADCILP